MRHMRIDQFFVRLKRMSESEFIQGPKPLLVEICSSPVLLKAGKNRCVRRAASRKKGADRKERKCEGDQQSCERKAKTKAEHGTPQQLSCCVPSRNRHRERGAVS
jgi:hypothetical protein